MSIRNCDTIATASLINFNRSNKACGSFAASCFAVNHHQLDSSQRFHCRNLTGHTSGVVGLEFSKDGTLLVSGGYDKIVRLWPISSVTRNEQCPIIPIEMKTRHVSHVYSLAITSDNRRLFSGGAGGKVFIHDVAT
jgi:WD40 repeat protein